MRQDCESETASKLCVSGDVLSIDIHSRMDRVSCLHDKRHLRHALKKRRRSDFTDDPSNWTDWIIEEIRRDDSTDNFPQYIMYSLCLCDCTRLLTSFFIEKTCSLICIESLLNDYFSWIWVYLLVFRELKKNDLQRLICCKWKAVIHNFSS